MSDIKLFRIQSSAVEELPATPVTFERSLQTLVERHLESLLGLRMLASDYGTGRSHNGRIDTLALDENGSPVIIEYKRTLNESIISQGLFYLDWLLEHRAEIKLLAMEHFDHATAERIEWAAPRLICVAGDFSRYDTHAIKQISRTIELIRYRRYGDDLLLFELLGNSTAIPSKSEPGELDGTESLPRKHPRRGNRTISERLAAAPVEVRDRFQAISVFMLGLGDDVQSRTLSRYVAFRRLTNFACVDVQPQLHRLVVYAKVLPEEVELVAGFSRNVRNSHHVGTGDLELIIDSDPHLEQAKPLLERSYGLN